MDSLHELPRSWKLDWGVGISLIMAALAYLTTSAGWAHLVIRGQRVLLDSDLAQLYGVETKKFNQQIKRNPERFPPDFMFELTREEFEGLRSQNVTSNRGGRRYLPMAFTEQGAIMAASVQKL